MCKIECFSRAFNRPPPHALSEKAEEGGGADTLGRAPAREGTEIVDAAGAAIGRVTSGGFGPSLNAPLAMGYVRADLAVDGTPIFLMVRGKPLPASIAPMPFVPHHYIR